MAKTQRILSPLRLPIPPSGPTGKSTFLPLSVPFSFFRTQERSTMIGTNVGRSRVPDTKPTRGYPAACPFPCGCEMLVHSIPGDEASQTPSELRPCARCPRPGRSLDHRRACAELPARPRNRSLPFRRPLSERRDRSPGVSTGTARMARRNASILLSTSKRRRMFLRVP